MEIMEARHIGKLNPCRRRGYYCRTEVVLYYRHTRCRFADTERRISRDSVGSVGPMKGGREITTYALRVLTEITAVLLG